MAEKELRKGRKCNGFRRWSTAWWRLCTGIWLTDTLSPVGQPSKFFCLGKNSYRGGRFLIAPPLKGRTLAFLARRSFPPLHGSQEAFPRGALSCPLSREARNTCESFVIPRMSLQIKSTSAKTSILLKSTLEPKSRYIFLGSTSLNCCTLHD